jgi:hypothetical protein
MPLRRSLLVIFVLLGLAGAPREGAAYFSWIHEMSGPTLVGAGYTCKFLGPRPFGARRQADNTIVILADGIVETRYPHGFMEGDTVQISKQIVTVVEVLGPRRFAIDTMPTGPLSGTVRAPEDQPRGRAEAAFSISQDRCFGIKNTSDPSPADDARGHFWLRAEATFYWSIEHPADPDNRPRVFALAPGVMFEVSPAHAARAGRAIAFAGIGVETFVFFGDGFDRFSRTALKIRPAAVRVNRVLGLRSIEAGLDVRYFASRFVPADFGRLNRPGDASEGDEWVTGAFVSLIF